MIHPQIHLNGSGKAALREQALDCMRSIKVAVEELCVNRPHGRDYYTLPEGSFRQAQDEYEAQIKKLQEVANFFEERLIYLRDTR